MNKIVIGFSKSKTWMPFSWAIMKAYSTPYSHVYVRFWSEKFGRHLIYQASHSRVNFMGQELFDKANVIVAEYQVQIEDANYIDLMRFAIDNSGRSYGVRQVFGMAMVRIAEIFGRKMANPYKDGNQTFVCSELGAYIVKNFAGGKIDRDADDMTPKDLYEYFNSLPENKV